MGEGVEEGCGGWLWRGVGSGEVVRGVPWSEEARTTVCTWVCARGRSGELGARDTATPPTPLTLTEAGAGGGRLATGAGADGAAFAAKLMPAMALWSVGRVKVRKRVSSETA